MSIKGFSAGAAIGKGRIVKFDAADHTVVLAAAATDLLVGVSDPVADAASGEVVDVRLDGQGEVVLGGTVTRGAWLTSDANGAAIAAAPATGSNVQVIGFALVSGVAGDIIRYFGARAVIQG